ncbi:PAS domain-containing protein [bacterium]|nr:PAS domain-containing protein [bacterium]
MIIPFKTDRSLGKQLLVFILLFSSLFTFASTIIQLWVDYRKDVKLIEYRIDQVQKTYITSLSLSIWNMNETHVYTQLNGILQLPEIACLEAKTIDKDYLVGERPLALGHLKMEFPIIHIDPFQQYEPVKVGDLIIYGDLGHAYNRLQTRFLIILGTQTVKTFSVSIFILFLVWTMITRYLNIMSDYTRKLTMDNLEAQLDLGKRKKTDNELDSVADAINDMRRNLLEAKEDLKKELVIQRDLNDKLLITIQELEAAEETLKQKEEQYRTLVNNIPGAIFRSHGNNRWNLYLISPAILDIAGYDSNSFMGLEGKSFASIVYENDLDSLKQAVEKAIREKSPYVIEYRIEHADGRLRWVYEKGQGIYSEKGELMFLDGVIFDVSDRKQTQEMMIQTEKMMSLGALAAGVAHEINNPLGVILMGAQNIQRRTSPSFKKNIQISNRIGVDLELLRQYFHERQIDAFIQSIKSSGERASRIVSNMLQFSRVNHDQPSAAVLSELLDRSQELASSDYNLKKKYDFKHINIVKQYEQEMSPVTCIETEIEQVLINLFSNAAYAMANNKKEIESQITIKTTTDGEFAKIEFEDNGQGMSDSILKRIFDPFYTTKPAGLGTGLGLSVSHTIITKNHGGTIVAESELGKGTKFIIRVPFDSILLSQAKETDTVNQLSTGAIGIIQ